jgi:ribonucleoside-diphosphate reductase alpha chain
MAPQQSTNGPVLTENALVVLKKRYLRKNEYDEVTETPADMFRRVANAVAQAELIYEAGSWDSSLHVLFYRWRTP